MRNIYMALFQNFFLTYNLFPPKLQKYENLIVWGLEIGILKILNFFMQKEKT